MWGARDWTSPMCELVPYMFSILIAYSEACRRAMHLFYTRHVRTIPHRATPILFLGFHHTSCFFYSLFSICSIVCLLYCRSNLQERLIGCSCFFTLIVCFCAIIPFTWQGFVSKSIYAGSSALLKGELHPLAITQRFLWVMVCKVGLIAVFGRKGLRKTLVIFIIPETALAWWQRSFPWLLVAQTQYRSIKWRF